MGLIPLELNNKMHKFLGECSDHGIITQKATSTIITMMILNGVNCSCNDI